MKKEYKIYKKGGYTYVHYDGFPKGVRIEKYSTLYDYDWGWMTISEKDERKWYDFHDEDWELFHKLLLEGTIVENDHLFGMVDKDGKEFLPCAFEQIEKLANSVYGRLGNSYWDIKYGGGSSTMRADYGDTGMFVKNGKRGWQEKGKVVIPAEYDEILHPSDSNFFQVENGGLYFYIDENQKPVLTFVREIEGDTHQNVPFPFYSHANDVLTLQEYVGHPVLEDRNVVKMKGVWQRLDRISGKDVCKLLVNPVDEKPLTEKDLELFNNNFSYEYAVCQVTSSEPLGVIDCLKKLQSMGLHSNTWHYIVKVWKPVGESPTAEELRFLRYQIEEHGQLGKLQFCLAHDNTLAKGETKMFAVTHYNERCWPAMWEYDWWEKRNVLSLPEIKKHLTKLRKTIKKEVLEPYREEVWQDQLWGCIYSIEYNKNRTWNETLKVLDYFKAKGSPTKDGIRKEAERINATLHFKNQFSRAKCAFHFRKLKWLLENEANVNAHYGNYTGLDYLVGNYKYLWEDNFPMKDKAYIEQMKEKFINLLLEHGAKTMQQVREEESLNEDYKVELKRMN
ncbi:MAG: WG repeat-containing protein [Bacteroidales bacterium]|nr:WG repeat-containing protein [Bacteroidales bacterium]